MIIQSINIGKPVNVQWRGKTVQTGIYKFPVEEPVRLEKNDVLGDHVIDRKYHGGIDKACYIFSADHYEEWKKLFPKLDWTYGMFGENLTISGLDEKDFLIGDILRLGGATVQISQPRQPCFKLGIRFGTQTVLKKFIQKKQPGIYLRILEESFVQKGDQMDLIERPHNSLKISEVWDLLYNENPDKELLDFALSMPLLSEGCKSSLRQVKKSKFKS
ncbi:MAG: MOSC domain-containing protein [Crocinitomicaceae bacterium]|nr:MOSC domain-containing protein [Crocinitomicaceae bacterium]